MRVIEGGARSGAEPTRDAERFSTGAAGRHSAGPRASGIGSGPGLPDPASFLVALEGCRIIAEPAHPGVLVPSHRGVDSLRWILSLDGQPASHFLKVTHPEQRQFADVATAFDAQAKAAALGCTPAPRVLDAEQGISVIERLDGWKTARMDDLRKPHILERVLSVKRRIHQGPRFKATWTVFDRVRALASRQAAIGTDAPEDLHHLLTSVAHIERAVGAAGWDEVPAHADGLASNIMIGPDGRILLVDFDEARNIDPYFEFAILLNEAFLPEETLAPALEIIDGVPRQASLSRIHFYAIADDLAWGLWGLVMDVTSARRDVEFLKYALWRLLRCRTRLQRTDLAAQLRQL